MKRSDIVELQQPEVNFYKYWLEILEALEYHVGNVKLNGNLERSQERIHFLGFISFFQFHHIFCHIGQYAVQFGRKR